MRYIGAVTRNGCSPSTQRVLGALSVYARLRWASITRQTYKPTCRVPRTNSTPLRSASRPRPTAQLTWEVSHRLYELDPAKNPAKWRDTRTHTRDGWLD